MRTGKGRLTGMSGINYYESRIRRSPDKNSNLMTLSKHFTYGYMASGVSKNERGNPLSSLHVQLCVCVAVCVCVRVCALSLNQVVEHWLKRITAQ